MSETTAHSASAHAKLAPSASHRWMACPGSIRISEGIANTSSSFANEGTAAHELASKCLNEGKDASKFIGWLINTQPAEGSTPFSPPANLLEEANGETTFEVDEDMADAVQVYLDHVRETYDAADVAIMSVEERLDMTDLHPGIYGTGDCTIYDHGAKHLHVFDYKHGKGVAVSATANPQLLLYGAGAVRRHHNLQVERITLHIVQPRAPHAEGRVRPYEIDALDLLEFEEDVRAAALATEAPDAPLHAGDHCRFCPAAAICLELRRHALALADLEFSGTDDLELAMPEAMTPEQRGKVLLAADFIQNWVKAVQRYEHDQAMAGNVAPGFKLVAKRATRRWKDPEGVLGVLQIDLGLGEDEIFERKLRSPAQLETYFPGKNKAARQAAMEDVVSKESSGLNLVPESDPRPAAKVEAATEFGE